MEKRCKKQTLIFEFPTELDNDNGVTNGTSASCIAIVRGLIVFIVDSSICETLKSLAAVASTPTKSFCVVRQLTFKLSEKMMMGRESLKAGYLT